MHCYIDDTHVTEVTDVHDLRMLHDKLVHRNRCDVEENASNEHCDDPWDPSKDARRGKLVIIEVSEVYIR
jgi:hypothetical protein